MKLYKKDKSEKQKYKVHEWLVGVHKVNTTIGPKTIDKVTSSFSHYGSPRIHGIPLEA